MVSVSVLGTGVGIDIREIIHIMAIFFIVTNILNASGKFPDLPDQIIVGIFDSLFNFEEELDFNWFSTITEGSIVNAVGIILDVLINAFFNIDISGLKILRILGMSLVWLSAFRLLLAISSTAHTYQNTMMGLPR